MASGKDNPNYKVVAENRRARYEYAIESDLECGIMLMGSEVKSLRLGQANIAPFGSARRTSRRAMPR